MKVCANIWEVASMANWSKYPKELFIQRRLLFSAFPLLLMVCLVNFLFLQVKGIKWISRFLQQKINPWGCWCVLYVLKIRQYELNIYTVRKIISYFFVPFSCLALKKIPAANRVDYGTLLRGCHGLMPCVQQIKFSSIPFTLMYFDKEMSLCYPCSCRELFVVKTLSLRRTNRTTKDPIRY